MEEENRIQTIPNEICGEIWHHPSQSKVQQEPVLYLPWQARWDGNVEEAELKLIWDIRRRNPQWWSCGTA